VSAAAIEISDLSYQVARTPILQAVSLAVEEGQYVSLLGPNGAGKTTLLKCLNRIVRRTSGSLRIFSRSIDTYKQRELGRTVSYVPQSDVHGELFSAREFVRMSRYPHMSAFSGYSQRDDDKVDEALHLTAANSFADRKMGTLSDGERQKISVAAAIAQEARIVLVDEPTAHLDYKRRVEMTTLLETLTKKSKLTVIAVTHEIDQTVFSSDLIVALKNGGVVFQGSPRDILEESVLEKIYDTPFEIIETAGSSSPLVIPQRDAR